MTTGALRLLPIAAAFVLVLVSSLPGPTHGVGGASTIAISHSTQTVCGVLAAAEPRAIVCSVGNRTFPIYPNTTSFDSISGGRDYFCGLRSDGLSSALFCWTPNATDVSRRRVFYGSVLLEGVSVGVDHVAASDDGGDVRFWRVGPRFPTGAVGGSYKSLTSGDGFSCAIERRSGRVRCWGVGGENMESMFRNEYMASIFAGEGHVCGLDVDRLAICKGKNESGQLGETSSSSMGAYEEYSTFAMGRSHTCAIRRANGTVVCWGGDAGRYYSPVGIETSFEVIVAGGDMTCGITSNNLSVVCWVLEKSRTWTTPTMLPLPQILPGFCTDSGDCPCGVFPDSDRLCSRSGVICKSCWDSREAQAPAESPPTPSPSPTQLPPPTTTLSNKLSRGLLVFAIVGSVGALAGLCTLVFCLWNGICRQKKVHNSVQPTITSTPAVPNATHRGNCSSPLTPFDLPPKPVRSKSRSSSLFLRRQGSRVMRRQRSGPSSSRHERAEEFSFEELAEATNHFSLENKIGAGSFGTVYRGKLRCGREVAIKRSERTNRFQEKESAFQSELAFLSRLHHKHLVGLVGFCEESDERLLVYEYMKNGALYDHLHSKEASSNNKDIVVVINNSSNSVLGSWKMRIKVLLDASRGIEYLHNYAVPPIIHRDIKSSNILLDDNWMARVSDFGLSLSGGGPGAGETTADGSHLKAAGTVGYMDPEYYGLRHLTVKSDVYGLGVVMLEVLTGRRAVFKEGDGEPMSVVDYAVGRIAEGEVMAVLDARMPAPGPREAEALERVAHTAVHCVKMEGRERPSMVDVVANLECALLLCDDSHGSISSASIASSD